MRKACKRYLTHLRKGGAPAMLLPMARDISPRRADRILASIGWSHAELRRQYNRLRGTRHTDQHVSMWFRPGGRGLPEGVQVFLRLSVTLAQVRRGQRR